MKNMGKKSRAVLLMLFVFLFCFYTEALAAEESTQNVSMEVSAVYGQDGRTGIHIPLTISVYDPSPAVFSGKIKLRTLENSSEDSSEIYEYTYPVTVQPAETKRLSVYVPLGQKSNGIHISLWGEKDKLLSERTMDFDVSKDTGRLMIGILSDQPEKLGYLDDIGFNYGMARSKTVDLDESSLPDDPRGLEMLDVLLINRFESDRLSEAQKNAVFQWVEQGGILLFGLGKQAFETTGGFYSRLPGFTIIGSRLENVNPGVEYDRNAPGDSGLSMICTSIWYPGGTEQMDNDGEPILTVAMKEKGKIGFFAYDLGDLSEFAMENPSYAAKLLTDTVGEDTISQLNYYGSYGREEKFWDAQSLVSTGNAERLPNLKLYTAAAVIYILIVGPGLYFFLKRKERSFYYGPAVMLCSLAAMCIIYLAGTATRFTSEFYTLSSIVDLSEERTEETTYLNIRTPDSRPFSVSLPPDYVVTPVTKSDRYGTNRQGDLEKRKSAALELRFEEDQTLISAPRSKAFDSRYFELSREPEPGAAGTISGDLEIFEGNITGSLTNECSFPLTDAVIYSYGQLCRVGTIAPGETIRIDAPLMCWSSTISYTLSEWLAGKNSGQDAKSYLESVEKSRMYSWFFNTYYSFYNSDVRIAAFGPTESIWSGLLTGEQSADGKILYTSKLEASSGMDDTVWRSGMINKPKVTSGGSYSDGMMIYGTEPVTVEYYLGTDIEVEGLYFYPVSKEFLETSDYSYMTRFGGEMYFYNYETKDYDRMDLSQTEFREEVLLPYLSSGNSITVKYLVPDTENSDASRILPVLMVAGRKLEC